MGEELNLGLVNGHIVGRVLKEAVRRGMAVIVNEQRVVEVTEKADYDGALNDLFTTADTKAQRVYLQTFDECFPDCGVIGEEDSLKIEPKNGCDAYFTVDPLDGTKAFVREQSHGIGTMIALVSGGKVISAYIGDVSANEVFGFRPSSDRVWRISHLNTARELTFRKPFGPENSYVLLREPLSEHTHGVRDYIAERFQSHIIDGGSIGTWMARLWKREVAAAILPPGWQTPWDSTPVMGICEKLGYVLFVRSPGGTWERVSFEPSTVKYRRTQELLVVHNEDVESLVP